MRWVVTGKDTWASTCGLYKIEKRPCFCPFVVFDAHTGDRLVQTTTLASSKRAAKNHHEEQWARKNRNRDDEPTEVVLNPEAFDNKGGI